MNKISTYPALQKTFFSILFFTLCLTTANTNAQCIYFKKIATGATSIHCLGIRTDGTLWGWGSNQFGQVGNNSLNNVFTPVQISNGIWKDIATGDGHSLAIDSAGKLWAWGEDNYGQLGDGAPLNVDRNVLTPQRITSPDSIWIAVAAASKHSAGLTADGKLWVWGYGTFYDAGGTIPNTPKQVGSDTDWAVITTGNTQFIVLKKDSTLWAWGRNGEGEAGDSTTSNNDYTPPVEIDSNHTWVSISAGYDHAIALQKDGSLWAWGANYFGQLGNGTTDNGIKGPEQIGTAKYFAIGAGNEFSVAISQDSLRWVWGTNVVGNFGNDTGGSNGTHQSLIPELSDSSAHWASVYANANASYNVSGEGTAWTAGDNGAGELGDGNNIRSNVLIKVGTPSPYPALATNGSSDTEYQRGYSYYANNCSNLITEVVKSGANPIHAATNAKVWIDATVQADNTGKPYVQRHYEISTASHDTTATGIVTVYFTQEEFTAYNAQAKVTDGTYPKLPVDTMDAAGYRGNVRIDQITATSSDNSGSLSSYQGTATLLTPSSVSYLNGSWQVTFSTTGFGGFFATTGATVLPLTWLSVKGALNSNHEAQIDWKVQEMNVAKYTIEKSTDGINFTYVADIASRGDGINSYQYTGNQILTGAIYYRIKQTGKDGKITYSTVMLLSNASGLPTVTLSPNPGTNHFFVNGLTNTTAYYIIITDMAGRVMLQKDISSGHNEVFTDGFSKGIYLVRIMTNTNNTWLKFIKE